MCAMESASAVEDHLRSLILEPIEPWSYLIDSEIRRLIG